MKSNTDKPMRDDVNQKERMTLRRLSYAKLIWVCIEVLLIFIVLKCAIPEWLYTTLCCIAILSYPVMEITTMIVECKNGYYQCECCHCVYYPNISDVWLSYRQHPKEFLSPKGKAWQFWSHNRWMRCPNCDNWALHTKVF